MDASLFRWMNRLAGRTGSAHPVFVAYAKYGIVLFAGLCVVAFLDARHRGDLRGDAAAVWAAGAAVVALGVAHMVGRAVDRARPYDAMTGVHVLIARTTDFSFPSDHATAVGAVAAGLLLGRRRRWGVLAAAGAMLMAFSRVYVGAHYPGDVVAGLAVGAGVAILGGLVAVPVLTKLAHRLLSGKGRVLVAGSKETANGQVVA